MDNEWIVVSNVDNLGDECVTRENDQFQAAHDESETMDPTGCHSGCKMKSTFSLVLAVLRWKYIKDTVGNS